MSQARIAKEFTLYTVGFVLMQVLTAGVAVYIRNTLGPEQMGVWVALQVLLKYTKYSNFGLAGAASREIPYERGRGNFARTENIRWSAFTFTLVASGVLSFAMAAGAFAFRGRFGELFFVSLLILAALSLFQRVSTFCLSMVRAERKFDFVNRFNVYSSLFNAGATVLLISRYGLYGYYASMLLSVVFNLAFLLLFSGVKFGLRLDWNELRGLFKMGVALIFVNMLGTLLDSVDKLAISTFLGMKALGVYSVAFMASNLVTMIPNNLSVILFPYLNEAYGATQSTDVMKKYVIKPNVFIALYMPMAIAFAWIAAPYAVEWLMPKYAEGLWPLKICMFGTLYMTLCGNLAGTLVTFKKHLWMIPVQAAVALAAFAANWLLIRNGAGLPGVACVEMAQYLALYAWYAAIAFGCTGETGLLGRHLARVAGLTAYYFVPLVAMDVFLPRGGFGLLALRLGVATALCVPMLIVGEKKFGALALALETLGRRKAKLVVPPDINGAEAIP